jgi:hypothetical protein
MLIFAFEISYMVFLVYIIHVKINILAYEKETTFAAISSLCDYV